MEEAVYETASIYGHGDRLFRGRADIVDRFAQRVSARSVIGGRSPTSGLYDPTTGQTMHLAGESCGPAVLDKERPRLHTHTRRRSKAREPSPGGSEIGNSGSLSSSTNARPAGDI